ncbi:MAG: J domain-containing protein [Pseudomonadota bacterium]|nr:J domain-containing protein [Pseudomonadota bacterium]MEC8117913.1 J domain-containing protein [Pseudomonadota bacterium]
MSPLRSTFEEPGVRRCDVPGCTSAGEFRAPKGRNQLNEYFWFCLDHVREYNRAWNYYAGMSEDEIEADVRRATTWNRPSWPFGTGAKGSGGWRVRDPFDFFEGEEAGGERTERHHPRVQSAEEKALQIMDLSPPVTLDEVKARYKSLVKRFHPDANGGDRDAEERLKLINDAYTTLKKALG